MVYKGQDLSLSINFNDDKDEHIAFSKSCTLDVASELIEVAKTRDGDGNFKQYIAGKYSWQVSSEMLIPVDDKRSKQLLACQLGGTVIEAIFNIGRSYAAFGYVLIQSISVSGAIGSLSTYKVTLTGVGPLKLSPG